MKPLIFKLTRNALCAALLAGLAGASQATPPLSNPSTSDLIAGLGGDPDGGLPKKAFRRTPAPDAATHACPEVSPISAAPAGGLRARNLTVVNYANDSAPAVNLVVNFVTNSDKIESSSHPTLNNLALALLSPSLMAAKVAVAGHTDAQGTLETNMVLSCARAIAVRNYLVGRNVPTERLGVYGFGPSRPLEPGATVSSANRRVEIRRAD